MTVPCNRYFNGARKCEPWIRIEIHMIPRMPGCGNRYIYLLLFIYLFVMYKPHVIRV